MKYVSIDIEGTSPRAEDAQVLQIGAVVDDTDWWSKKSDSYVPVEDLPVLDLYIDRHEIKGQLGALVLNAGILKFIHEYRRIERSQPDLLPSLVPPHKKVVMEWEAADALTTWISQQLFGTDKLPPRTAITVAGKNFNAYDRPLILGLPRWDKMDLRLRQNVLDPTVLYWHPYEDEKLPNLDVCLDRARINKKVSHDAVDDAKDVIMTVREFYNPGGDFFEPNMEE